MQNITPSWSYLSPQTRKKKHATKILKANIYFLMIYCRLRYILDGLSSMIFYNISGKRHSSLSEKSISEIFFIRFLVLVRLVGLMAFEGCLQALVRPAIRFVSKNSYKLLD